MTRAFVPSYELRRVATLDEALALVASEPGAWRPFAGGTDLMVQLDAGTLSHRKFVNLWGLPELRGIVVEDAAIAIGALTTYTDVRTDARLASEFPLLAEAAAETGGVATQNRGTIGGNIANASPAADMPPVLLVYDAELEIASLRGTRRVAYERFHAGYKQMDLAGDEIITRVWLPRGVPRTAHAFRKVGTRRAQAISKVCFAGTARVTDGVVDDLRVAFGSVAPTVIRARHAEGAIRGGRLSEDRIERAVTQLTRDIAPIDDIRSTARYRATVASNLLKEFLHSLCA